jgi:hypothetical protein
MCSGWKLEMQMWIKMSYHEIESEELKGREMICANSAEVKIRIRVRCVIQERRPEIL